MISGTLTTEDNLITFTEVGTNQITYTICDPITGKQETKTVQGKYFMAALGILLDYAGGDHATVSAWTMAERAQPDNRDLRFIP